MHVFGMLFWIAALWLAFRAFRSWSSCGSRGYRAHRGWERREVSPDQQSYIDSLETRVAELEERLDFTERLVAGRGGAVS